MHAGPPTPQNQSGMDRTSEQTSGVLPLRLFSFSWTLPVAVPIPAAASGWARAVVVGRASVAASSSPNHVFAEASSERIAPAVMPMFVSSASTPSASVFAFLYAVSFRFSKLASTSEWVSADPLVERSVLSVAIDKTPTASQGQD